MILTKVASREERKKELEKIVTPFSERAWMHDKEASFPAENIEELKKAGFHTLTVPKKYGGLDISLLEMIQLQETIAKKDGSTALAIGWHMGIVKHLGEKQSWKEETYEKFCYDVIKNGALLNNAASERATGSPTRGGKPETTAIQKGDCWIINGTKTFTTMAPVLDYFVVSAYIPETEQIGNFLIHRSIGGITINETWDSVAMRATGSHDLVLKDVEVPLDQLVEYIVPGKKQAAGWLLHIPACYLGIAKAAQQYALEFATTYSPNSIEGTIADLPFVKQKLGEIELYIKQSQYFLYSVATKWDQSDVLGQQQMLGELGAVKHSVVNHAMQVVDLAMRVLGARSLSEKNPLQRLYRDVRAGLHNPPMDDATIILLADESIQRLK